MLRRDESLSFKLTPGLLFTRPAKGGLDTLNQMKAAAFTDGTIDCWGRGLAADRQAQSGSGSRRIYPGEAVASSHIANENKKAGITMSNQPHCGSGARLLHSRSASAEQDKGSKSRHGPDVNRRSGRPISFLEASAAAAAS